MMEVCICRIISPTLISYYFPRSPWEPGSTFSRLVSSTAEGAGPSRVRLTVFLFLFLLLLCYVMLVMLCLLLFLFLPSECVPSYTVLFVTIVNCGSGQFRPICLGRCSTVPQIEPQENDFGKRNGCLLCSDIYFFLPLHFLRSLYSFVSFV